MLSGEHLAVEEPIDRGGNRPGVGLATYPEGVRVEGNRYRLALEGAVHREQVEDGLAGRTHGFRAEAARHVVLR